jgi:endonuclease/exonuclease/phosphatase family metal-dependent hydrolase
VIRFKVLFFNVGNGLVQPERLAHALRESEADLIGLVELTSSQAVAVEALSNQYPYQYLNGAGIVGKGLVSRLPLHDAQLIELYPQRPDLYACASSGGDDDSRKLRVIVAHPPPQRTRMRMAQLRSLLSITTGGESGLLMGDFNMVQSEATYRRYVTGGLVDAYRSAGRGAGHTYPVRRYGIRLRPLIRLDFIWHTQHLRAQRAWLGKDQGSDHLPVFAELTW